MIEDCVGIACDNTCLNGSSTTSTSSASSSRKSTIAGSDIAIAAPVHHNNSTSLKRRYIAFLPLLFSQNIQQPISADSLGLVTVKELEELSRRMTSRGFDRSVRQTIPTTRRKARTSPRSSSVSSDVRSSSRLETQDLVEAEREYQRQQELEKSASDLAMEAMEYKFLSRRKRLMARKLARETKDKSDLKFDDRQQSRMDSNGNLVNVSRSGTQSVAPDLSLSITTKMDFCDPEVLLEKPEACRELTADESVRAKHDREMKKYDESESNDKKRSRFTASLIRTNTSDSDQEPEEDSGYEAKSCLTDATNMDPSRAVSRGSFSSSLRPLSSEFEESAWGSQELLESDSSARKKSTKSRSSDDLELEHDMFQDAEECLESFANYGDFEAGGIETPAEYEVIDLPPTRIDVKDKVDKSDKNNYTKDSSTPFLMKTRKPRTEGRRSTSDPVRDRISSPALHLPSVVRRGSTAMPYHFTMPSTTLAGYMKPTVASLRAKYEREEIEGNNGLQTSARDRFKISDEDNYRIKKAEEDLKNKKLEEERNKRYEEWLKKLDEVNILPQSAKERVKKLESEIYRIKKPDETESRIARAYRRRLLEDENELIFPISRKTQTKPDLSYQVKMISRSSQTDEVPSNDASVNTEIDFRLMSALLDKLLISKTSVAVQTDWKNDVIETRDVGVSTERIFRERFSPLPSLRSMSAQTEVSALRSKDKSVATDLEITGHRHRNRSSRDLLSTRLSSGVQTDQKWISRKDVSCEANFSSFSSESEESVVSAYPKGFHPKTGQLLDQKLLSNYYKTNDQNNGKYSFKSRDQNLHKLSKTPEPIIEEYGTSSSSESYSEGDYNTCENVREIYREKYAEYKTSKSIPKSYYMRSEEKRVHLDLNDRKRHRDRNLLETDLEEFDREPIKPEIRAQFTADKQKPQTRHGDDIKPSQITTKPLPLMKTSETQTNDILTVAPQSVTKPQMKFISKDLKTESKIIVEVTKARKKERSEVTSLTKLDDDGKMSRTTRVTTSKHIPVLSDRDMMRKIREDKMSSTSTPQRPLSPMRKAQSEINVTPVSDVSTRPASAVDLSMMQTQTGPKIPSTFSLNPSVKSSGSSLKSPSPPLTRYADEITVPKVGRVSIQDPMHLVLIAPPESFDNKERSLLNGDTLLMPIDKSHWRETSTSTICNEMSTDAFKDDEGNVQKPKSVTMTTETMIENKGSESKVQTRSRTARKYAPEVEENAITTESNFTGTEDPYIDREHTSQPFTPRQTSPSPLVTLVDTPDIPDFLSPEPEPLPEVLHQSDRNISKANEFTSLGPDVRSSSYRPEEVEYNKLVDKSRRAAIVEPVQQVKTAVQSDNNKGISKSSAPPATEIITRIIRTSQPDESKKFRKSKTVLEQELQSGDMSVDGGGCRISSSITFDNPNTPNRGVIIKELNEDGTSKDGSMDNLDQKSGEILTETSFQRFKTPRRGSNGCEETSWKYSMECNCVNGSNTTVRSSLVVFSSSAAQPLTTSGSLIH